MSHVDQPVRLSAIVARCLDSTISPVSITKVSSLYLVSVTAQTGSSLPWSQTPKTGFLLMRYAKYEAAHTDQLDSVTNCKLFTQLSIHVSDNFMIKVKFSLLITD